MSRRVLLRLLPAIVWLGLILVITSLPSLGIPLPRGLDKVLHAALYLGLAVLAVAGLHLDTVKGLFLRALAAVPIMTLVAGADELHQRWIPGRSADPLDFAADVAGIAAGTCIVLVIVWWRGPSTGSGPRGKGKG